MTDSLAPTALLLFASLLFSSVLQAADDDPRIARVIDSFNQSVGRAQAERDEVIAAADQDLAQATQRAQQRAIRDLKRMVTSRTDAATTAIVYREVLSLDQYDADARAFFTAIGTLDDVLATLESRVETDFMGNAVAATPQSGISSRTSRVSRRQADALVANRDGLSQADWDRAGGLEVTLPAAVPWTPVSQIPAGATVLVVAAPDDRWSHVGSGGVNAAGGHPFATGRIMELRAQGQQIGLAGVVVVPAEGLQLGSTDMGHTDNTGSMRVKILLVR